MFLVSNDAIFCLFVVEIRDDLPHNDASRSFELQTFRGEIWNMYHYTTAATLIQTLSLSALIEGNFFVLYHYRHHYSY